MSLMTPADFCLPRIPVYDNWLDVLPTDITNYIIELSSVPSTKDIARMVYDETMACIDYLDKQDELEVYNLTFKEGDEDDMNFINNTAFGFLDWDISVSQVYNEVESVIDEILIRLSPRQTNNMFQYYFKNYDDACRHINNDKYNICSYLYDNLDEYDDEIESQALRYLMLISFHEHYKCVFDKENKIPDIGGDEGDYFLRMTFVELNEGELPYAPKYQ